VVDGLELGDQAIRHDGGDQLKDLFFILKNDQMEFDSSEILYSLVILNGLSHFDLLLLC
jgi:hypothetical protein